MGLFDFKEKERLKLSIQALERELAEKVNCIESLNNKYGGIISIEEEIKKLNAERHNKLKSIEDECLKLKKEKEADIQRLETLIEKKHVGFDELEREYQTALSVFHKLKIEIEVYDAEVDIYDHGIYKPIFDLTDTESLKAIITECREEQKQAIKSGLAVICSTVWTVSDSVVKGRVMTKRYMKLMLRAFNGECDALISKVKWNNVNMLLEKLDYIYDKINVLGESNDTIITPQYLELKRKELKASHEYNVKKYREKEEQRALREEQREEQKALKELERAQVEAEREEEHYQRAIEKVKKEIESATGSKYDSLIEKIDYLQLELAKAKELKERAISMAQQTRCGYVYIISNIGSFGEDVFKIGMTRRLDPEDRIRELSNASVPFKYDIHALIYSEDAPKLERELHGYFDDHKVNIVNGRKEFFNITITSIKERIVELGIAVDFVIEPEAREFRETETTKNTRKANNNIETPITPEYPKSLLRDFVIGK